MKKYLKRLMYYLPRKLVTKIRFFYVTKKILNLKKPKDFNEKVVYLMLNEFGDKERECTDKYQVREYVKSKGLDEILTKLYGKFDSTDEIDFSKLPDQYVLKTNHGSGCTIIKNSQNEIDEKTAKNKLKVSLNTNYAKETLEYHYEKIKPCILCEEYLKEDNKISPTDYKIFCFNGIAKFILVCGNRTENLQIVYYDLEWNKMEYTKTKLEGEFKKPKNFEKMIEIAEILSKDFKFVRVDLYNIDGKIYFGELTFTPRGGINNTIKQEYLDIWGDLIEL